MKHTDPSVILKKSFPKPVTEVWEALTDPGRMRAWFFPQIAEFEPESGFETRFEVESGGRTFPHVWKVTDVKSPEWIRYDWHYEGYPGKAYVDFRLKEVTGSTILVLTFSTVEDFPGNIPEFTRESCKAGWDFLIGERLSDYLAG